MRIYIEAAPIRHSSFARQGGAGRPGSRPLASDLIARGTKNALLGRLRRPPGAWIGLSTDPAGSRSLDFAASGRPALGALALGRSIHQPADAPDYGTPAPNRGAVPATASPSPRRRQKS